MKRLQNGSTLEICVGDARIVVPLRLEDAFFDNHKFIVIDDGSGLTLGVLRNETVYLIGDRVEVTGDVKGYIGGGITKPGLGYITQIERNCTDHYFGVEMDNGEFGFVKSARIEILEE